jgi:hypothetical protein
MLITEKVKNVVILCGSNENELHHQLKTDFNTAVEKFIETEEKQNEIKKVVTILKSSDLKHSKEIGNDTLLIWDECHYAQRKTNLPAKYLERSKLKVNGTKESNNEWKNRNSYCLAVSATPFAAYSDMTQEDLKDIVCDVTVVYHHPSKIYRGVEYYKEKGFFNSFRINEEGNDKMLKKLIKQIMPQKKYILIRSQRNLEIVSNICEELEIDFSLYTDETKDIPNIDYLKNEPENTTVIGLKGMCRMGKVVPKRYLGMIFEESQTTNSDSMLQSLLGRICGHNSINDPYPDEDIKVYIPSKFLKTKGDNPSEIDRYLQFQNEEKIIPREGACLVKNSIPKNIRIPLEVRYIDNIKWKQLSDSDRWNPLPVERNEIIRELINDIRQYPYSDKIQQNEVLKNFVLDKIEFHNMYHKSYSYVSNQENGLPTYINDTVPVPRWNDRWAVDKFFKVYRGNGRIYLVGYTEEAEYELSMKYKNAIPSTTQKEVWHPKEEIPRNDTLTIMTKLDDINVLKENINKFGVHTIFIHKSLKNNDVINNTILQMNKGVGRCGKYWPRDRKDERDKFDRIVVINVTVPNDTTEVITNATRDDIPHAILVDIKEKH